MGEGIQNGHFPGVEEGKMVVDGEGVAMRARVVCKTNTDQFVSCYIRHVSCGFQGVEVKGKVELASARITVGTMRPFLASTSSHKPKARRKNFLCLGCHRYFTTHSFVLSHQRQSVPESKCFSLQTRTKNTRSQGLFRLRKSGKLPRDCAKKNKGGA